MMKKSITERLQLIHSDIESACRTAGRSPEHITLIAASKTQPIEKILELYEAGQRHFGESRLQEALPKIERAPKDIVWHFIGTLQSNKARKIAENFHAIHTLSKPAQLKEIQKSGHTVDGLVEINIADEPQKAGIPPAELDEFVELILQCSSVRFRGLMTIGPALDPEAMRPYFRQLSKANEKVGGQWLSMGMSSDFDVAIQEGATHIRVGTALFGAR
jgi:pyridoxal phosphate enzyme (YggS family)